MHKNVVEYLKKCQKVLFLFGDTLFFTNFGVLFRICIS